jgi:formate--tetrahydrofolate ligase
MRPLEKIVEELGVREQDVTYYGKSKAKLSLLAAPPGAKPGKLVLVTGMTPTAHGEGKTVVSIGLSMGLAKLGRRAVATIRQPSSGPVFGIKGGGAGGGAATLEPMQEVNLRLTGDFDAVAAAHNLLAAMVENHIFHGNELRIDPHSIVWPRTVDVEDRSLREVMVGLGEKSGVWHKSKFIITAASEVMAILCLTRGYADYKARLGRILVGYTDKGEGVTASQLGVVGSMAALTRDALLPNLVQTSEGTPALVHGGPFGNIAHGTSSLISIDLALRLGEYAVVEAGFGSDLGAEKFVDIVAGPAGLQVDAAVIVATVRALKYQGGEDNLEGPHPAAVERGLENLAKHIENVRTLGIRPVVTVNRFTSDRDDELRLVYEFCRSEGVPYAVSSAYLDGGAGSMELARLVVEEAEKGSSAKALYDSRQSVREKVDAVVRKMYGGDGVTFTEAAESDLRRVEGLGLHGQPVCIAKTAASLSDDPTKRGRPSGFVVTAHAVEEAAGAGFNIIHMGDIVRMPGLPKSPAAERIQVSDDGVISGVS